MKRKLLKYISLNIFLVVFLLNINTTLASQSINFSFLSYKGETYEIKDFSGKYIILNFFASDCPMCMAELNVLESVYKTCNKNVQVISLIIDKQGLPLLPYIIKVHHLTYIVGIAPDKAFKLLPDFSILPTCFLLNKKGVLLQQITGLHGKSYWLKLLNKYTSCN